MKYLALVAVLALASCEALREPSRTIDADKGGAVILDALEWGKASIERDVELAPVEKEIALRSCAIAENLVHTARGAAK